MQRIREVRLASVAFVIAMAVLVSFSAVQARAATNTLFGKDCSLTNWCSGGLQNCIDCCGGDPGSICYSYDPNIQGCLCF